MGCISHFSPCCDRVASERGLRKGFSILAHGSSLQGWGRRGGRDGGKWLASLSDELSVSFAQLGTPGHGNYTTASTVCLPSSSKPSENTQDSYIQRCVSTVTINPIRLIISTNTTRHSTNPPSTTPAVLEHRTETCSQGHSKPYHYSIICGLNGP